MTLHTHRVQFNEVQGTNKKAENIPPYSLRNKFCLFTNDQARSFLRCENDDSVYMGFFYHGVMWLYTHPHNNGL